MSVPPTDINGWIDVQSLRVSGDADWTNAINLAIGALAADGGVLYFSPIIPGTYATTLYDIGTTGLTVGALPSNTTIVGCGIGTVIVNHESSSPIFTAANKSNLVFSQMGFSGIRAQLPRPLESV
jgi:hypothetical protein